MKDRKRFWGSPWILLLAATLMVACTNVDEAAFEEGMEAYSKGDFQTAHAKWRPLAEGGNPSAQTNLGVMYYQGRGVARNYEEAVKWYKMAALKGYPDALFNLGVAYAEGKGVERDAREALRWYRLAGENGYVAAQLLLADTYYKGNGVAVDHREAAKWYQQAAQQGDPFGQFFLANLYLNGQGVVRDPVKAYMWFYLASAHEDSNTRANADLAKRRVAESLTESEIAEAERLAQEWTEKQRESAQQ